MEKETMLVFLTETISGLETLTNALLILLEQYQIGAIEQRMNGGDENGN